MKAKKAAIIFGTLTLLGSISASVADLRGSSIAPVFEHLWSLSLIGSTRPSSTASWIG
jgi:hypothetical protein